MFVYSTAFLVTTKALSLSTVRSPNLREHGVLFLFCGHTLQGEAIVPVLVVEGATSKVVPVKAGMTLDPGSNTVTSETIVATLKEVAG